jgi:uncharacterized protein (DUF433 family)
MALELRDEPVPLAIDSNGVVRIAGTRITLDTVVAAFNEGFSAEEIAEQYPTLTLADVYSVIGYYLRYRSTLDAHLRERQAQGERVRAENESRFDPRGLQARLLARRPGSRS